MLDELDEEFKRLTKRFNSNSFERYSVPEELKTLEELLTYRELKKKYEYTDIEVEAGILINSLQEKLKCLLCL